MQEKGFKEFSIKVRRANDKRHHTMKNSVGIRDLFLFLQSNKWLNIGQPLKEQQFQQIVRRINNYLAKEVAYGREIKFPHGLGVLELRKTQYSPARYKNGKIVVSYPIDWDETLKLWYEDEEAYRDKTLVRRTSRDVFKFVYNKMSANYKNQMYIEFKLNRFIKNMLTKHIKQGQVSTIFNCDNDSIITR